MNLGRWEIDDFLTFTCNTHDPETGAATDADSVPSYRVYEDETGTPILTGSMALLDSANTAGFYSERIQLTAASGFETGKTYTIYISATVNSTEGTISHSFQVEAALASAADLAVVDANVDAILVDTGTTLPATLSTIEGKIDTVDTVVDGIKAVTDNLPDSGALTTIDSNIDAILVDTGTDIPASIAALNDLSAAEAADAVWDELASGHVVAGSFGDKLQNKVPSATIDDYKADVSALALEATVQALNDLSSADIQTVIENNDLDHLAKVAHPTGDPVANTLFDYIFNKDGSQTFDRTSDSLEALGESSGATPAQIADAVWDELASGHVTAGSFGDKLQNKVPSATIDDYKADVSALSTQASVDTIDGNVDLILADTNELQTDWTDGGRLDLILDAVKAKTDNLPADPAATSDITALNDPSAADVADAVWDEAIAGHVGAGTFGAKNQNLVPSETITDYRADVSALALETTAQAIKAKTDNLPADPAATSDITALNDLSSADVQTVLENNDLDHLAKVAHPTGTPTADSLFDLIMSKDAGQNFNRATDSLEALRDENYEGPTLQQIVDGVWDEAASSHVSVGSFGEKNQNQVPSETLNDYKADVSALATSADLATVDSNVDAIKAKTDNLPADPAATSDITALNDLSSADVQTVLENNDLDHLAKVAHPSGDPVANTLFDYIMNKDGAQTFDRSTDSLEVLGEASGATPAQIADAVWDELASGHVTAGSFGDKLQNKVPSATIGDYHADTSALATTAALATVDANVDAIKAKTDNLPADPAATSDITALNDLSSSDIQIVLQNNDLDHLLKTAHPTGIPVAGTIMDLIMNKDVSQTFDRSTDALEAIAETSGLTAGQVADAVWDEAAAAHVVAGTFGDKLQNKIPSATIDDYKADVSGLATAAALAVVDGNVDSILLDTTDILTDTADLIAGQSDLDDGHDDILADTALILAAVGGGPPAGAITWVYNVTNQVSGQPIGDVDVWVTTDIAGSNVVASGRTDAFGNVTFYLDAGTYYLWSQKSGFNFENPDEEVVS